MLCTSRTVKPYLGRECADSLEKCMTVRCNRHAFLLITALVTPSFAADGDEKLKQELEKLAAAFNASYNKQDSAGIAALFASGGVLVNPGGVHTDIAKFYDGVFKTGFNHNE